MADDKTEQPTAHKLREARKKGQVIKSNDAVSAIVLLAVFIFFSSMGSSMFNKITEIVQYNITNFSEYEVTASNIRGILIRAFEIPLYTLVPIAMLAVVAGVFGHLIQTGIMFSGESIKFSLEKMNPVEGTKKIFSSKSFIELLKVLIRTILIVAVFRSYLMAKLPELKQVPRMYISNVFQIYGSTLLGLMSKLVMIMVVTGGLDYFLQRYQFMKQMMMTKHEIKEEMKSTEGDPFMKQRIRSKLQSIIKKRMLEGVAKSRVVITNPTHFAVALKFDEEEDEAPWVIAKGQDLMAEQIKKLARKHEVQIVENKPIAQALYWDVEVGEEIPEDLYQAIAEIIAFVESLEMGLENTGFTPDGIPDMNSENNKEQNKDNDNIENDYPGWDL
ncbi:MAG: flagellar biosynthesis protein FlhB [Vulcanimicrobiota bacterium]